MAAPTKTHALSKTVGELRAETPLVASGRAHLNNAGASAQPRAVIDAVNRHLELEHAIGGYEAAAEVAPALQAARLSVARCIEAEAANVAFTESATASYALALSSFDFAPSDTILLSRYDYASNQIMAISLARRRGVRIVRAGELPDGGIDPDSVEDLIREHRPKLVSLSQIPTSTGMIQDAAAVGEVCRLTDTPYLVDACQSVGQMPVDAPALHCDFLCGTGRKFLRGPRGTGFLYVADRVFEQGRYPLLIDMNGADWRAEDDYTMQPDARRFELWESHVAGRLGLGAAAEYAVEVGIEAGFERACALAQVVRQRAASASHLRVIDAGAAQGAIVSLAVDTDLASSVVLNELRARGVNTSVTDLASAVLDLEQRTGGAQWALRVSSHYFNVEDDLDRLFAALEEIL